MSAVKQGLEGVYTRGRGGALQFAEDNVREMIEGVKLEVLDWATLPSGNPEYVDAFDPEVPEVLFRVEWSEDADEGCMPIKFRLCVGGVAISEWTPIASKANWAAEVVADPAFKIVKRVLSGFVDADLVARMQMRFLTP